MAYVDFDEFLMVAVESVSDECIKQVTEPVLTKFVRVKGSGSRATTRRSRVKATTTIVLANVAKANGHWVGLSTSRLARGVNRYTNPDIVRELSEIVRFLTKEGWLETKIPKQSRWIKDKKKKTEMRATDQLLNLLPTTFSDDLRKSNRVTTKEVIELRKYSARKNYWAPNDRPASLVAYTDDDHSDLLRQHLVELNNYLGNQDYSFATGVKQPRSSRTTQVRTFCDSAQDWSHGGRYKGAFWQSMSSSDRLGIRINGVPVVELDYKALHLSIVLALNQIPFNTDPYAVLPGLPRGVVKTLISSELSRAKGKRLIRCPQTEPTYDGRTLAVFIREVLKMKPNQILSELYEHFPGLELAVIQLDWRELQNLESEVLSHVLRMCMDRDIPALGVHDSVLVPSNSNLDLVEQFMKDSFSYVTNNEEARILVNRSNSLNQ